MDDYMPPRYQMLGRIGEGVHGVVVKARDLSNDDKIVAIKKLTLRTKHGWIAPNAIREIKVLQNSQCENVSAMPRRFRRLNVCFFFADFIATRHVSGFIWDVAGV